MKLEHLPPEQLKQMLRPLFSRHLSGMPYQAFFFGSRVSGTSHERSDIDIGIDAGAPLPISLLEELKEDIEDLPILYSVDVVDIERTSPDFKKLALQHIEPLL